MALDPGVRRIGDGTVLVGGSPIRVLRLTPAGRDLVDRLATGEPVPATAGPQSLTRRLLDAGLADPRPATPSTLPDVTVVIPVRNDRTGLASTLAALRAPLNDRAVEPGRTPVIVVDDASGDPALPDSTGARHSVTGPPHCTTVIRRSAQGGPAAARNDGWREATTEFVAFLDANCEPEPDWLNVLLPHFGDPQVAAVAPRIISGADAGAPEWLAAYEDVCSPLDLGGREAIVRPGSPVAYVPTAALVVRRAALEALGGFDEGLIVGEDVDFVWRLVGAGWTVRYEPRATVRHPMRPTPTAWLAQRYRYGTSAAVLARRHGAAVAPAVLSPWTAAAWGLLAAGHPVGAAAAATYSIAALTGRLPPAPPLHRGRQPDSTGRPEPDPDQPGFGDAGRTAGRDAGRLPATEAVRLAGLGHLRGGLSLARAVRRAWPLPALLLAVASRKSRPALAAAVVVPGIVDWVGRRPRLDPVRFAALRLADDLAYAAGLWAGCGRERSFSALCPHLGGARNHPIRQTDASPSRSIGGRA